MNIQTLLQYIPGEEGVLAADGEFLSLFAAGIASEYIADGKIREPILSALKENLLEEVRELEIPADGRNWRLRIQRIYDDEEIRYLVWMRDISAESNDRRMLSIYEEILDHINEGVIVTDSSGRIIIYNKKLGEFENLEPGSIIGLKLKDVYDDWSKETSEHYQVFTTGEPIKEGYYRNMTKDGRTNHLVASSFPIRIDGKMEAACSVSRNIATVRKLYESALGLQTAVTDKKQELKNGTRYTFSDIIHQSSGMEKLISDAEKAARNDVEVLVCGETGTGKELIVQSIHNASARRKHPFVALNCAALPENLLESLLFGTKKGAFTGAENTEGFFDQAGEGTLYLDEVNSMPLNLQAKFLRAIQEKRFRRIGENTERTIRCKIISSMNADPLRSVERGQLRQDLYYRLSTIVLEIPPLRRRREDIELLTDFFCKKYSLIFGVRKLTLDRDLKQAMMVYDWPGNVRELEHLIERGISLLDNGETLTLYNMPSYLREKLYSSRYVLDREEDVRTLGEILYSTEKMVIREALQKNGMNITRAAKALGLKRQSMQYRIEKLDLKEFLKAKTGTF